MIQGRSFLLLLVFAMAPLGLFAQDGSPKLKDMTIEEYIKKYADIAKSEMRRVGIPASITLAQGILESNFGNSELAKNANNHFGVKCHDNWSGKGYLMDDDAKRECFRVYESALESFMDHSNFIKSRERYAFLFELDVKDYKSWAKGLKNAGYATNPQYANLLIRIIEERNLSQFDTADPSIKEIKSTEQLVERFNDKIFLFNNIKTVIVQPNQTIEDLAAQYHVDVRQLKKYNDWEEGDSLVMGTKIYLQPKRATGVEKTHTVKKGETIKTISQKQGIKISALLDKNHMEFGQEPEVGAVLCLKKVCDSLPPLKSDEEIRKQIRSEIDAHQKEMRKLYIQQREDSIAAAKNMPLTQTEVLEEEDEQPIKAIDTTVNQGALFGNKPLIETPEGEAIYHTVSPKETLFSISKKYYTTVDNLKNWNTIGTEGINPGQKLIVGYGSIPVPPKIEIINPLPEDTVKEEAFSEYHIVKPGESLFVIAKQYKITTAQIKEWNKLTSNELKAGQKLLVYNNNPTTKEEAVPLEEEIENNKRDKAPVYHEVLPGETLYGIAKKYNVSVDDLKRWNNIEGSLKSGTKLVIDYKQEDLPEENDQPRFHSVGSGDTLYSIARTYGVTVQQIKQWNKMTTDKVKLGEKLIIGY
ncbi:MAG: LysM peptidoglycan-binding domain-containing protein [Chitinophagales bacterium]|nr:LysM peptidoglycan-binding domain-containing protein [Chitinophagales bacterium]